MANTIIQEKNKQLFNLYNELQAIEGLPKYDKKEKDIQLLIKKRKFLTEEINKLLEKQKELSKSEAGGPLYFIKDIISTLPNAKIGNHFARGEFSNNLWPINIYLWEIDFNNSVYSANITVKNTNYNKIIFNYTDNSAEKVAYELKKQIDIILSYLKEKNKQAFFYMLNIIVKTANYYEDINQEDKSRQLDKVAQIVFNLINKKGA